MMNRNVNVNDDDDDDHHVVKLHCSIAADVLYEQRMEMEQ